MAIMIVTAVVHGTGAPAAPAVLIDLPGGSSGGPGCKESAICPVDIGRETKGCEGGPGKKDRKAPSEVVTAN